MWELGCKEGWTPKNWYFQTVALEKTLQSLLDCKEIEPVNPKGNQPWIFVGRTDAEGNDPIPDVKSWLIEKDPDAGKTEGKRTRVIVVLCCTPETSTTLWISTEKHWCAVSLSGTLYTEIHQTQKLQFLSHCFLIALTLLMDNFNKICCLYFQNISFIYSFPTPQSPLFPGPLLYNSILTSLSTYILPFKMLFSSSSTNYSP